MYPTFGFRRWVADNDRVAPSFGVGVGGIVDDGEAETFELGDGFTSACGEQAVLKRTATSRPNRTRFIADITTAERICYPMTSDDVAHLARLLAEGGIEVWLDGGWAVDALLGEQTRRHDDVDIVVRDADLPRALEILAKEGFGRTEGGRPFNFVLQDGKGRKVDVHTIVFDSSGNGLFGPDSTDGKQEMYEAGALTGRGMVGGEAVQCVSPDFLMTYYTGYPISPSDAHDVQQLHRRFGLDLPAEYRKVPEIRAALASDLDVLREMSFYAARWRPGQENDSRESVLSDDHVARYVDDWRRPGDTGFVAEEHGQAVGAAWVRLFTRERAGYGFIDSTIPELSIGVVPTRRGSGIGLALLTATLDAVRHAGHRAVSLSVEVDNPALRLYERVGFKKVDRVGGSWTMRFDLVA
jgi:lincosamide nucleotidyltransferase A/C/D/E